MIVASILIMFNFQGIFKEILGLPPAGEIEFYIELLVILPLHMGTILCVHVEDDRVRLILIISFNVGLLEEAIIIGV